MAVSAKLNDGIIEKEQLHTTFVVICPIAWEKL